MLKGRTLRLWHSSGKRKGSNRRPWSMDEHRRLRQHVHAIRLHVNSVGLLQNSIRILSRRSGSNGTVAFLIQCPSSLQESRFHLRLKALPIRDRYRLIPGDLNKKSRREVYSTNLDVNLWMMRVYLERQGNDEATVMERDRFVFWRG